MSNYLVSLVYGDPIEVKIWFSAEQARFIKERKWSQTQKIKDQKDGSIILSMQTSGGWEVKKWVLSYGADAKVLEPEALKKEIVEELNKPMHNYKQIRQKVIIDLICYHNLSCGYSIPDFFIKNSVKPITQLL